ncbi:uncharacterized protein LOC111544638 [Piliocolobus tephrosceles]|uniref:uncharacterized protein LOC111544638 n=1 Tax=Piliocolobus tephrosceles TaxID=591936 RepID=UPI000E6B4271|nr:uncharacterized protein LOC111544638 [Piliocolobus tephrosceles]XP_023071048.2 uncharacterized protein LOC111544638 [Piliocolobus tephrosceles]XP_023071050.2 uncharacterized protein LOC111544638 [Piliocolobus tephrosceles]
MPALSLGPHGAEMAAAAHQDLSPEQWCCFSLSPWGHSDLTRLGPEHPLIPLLWLWALDVLIGQHWVPRPMPAVRTPQNTCTGGSPNGDWAPSDPPVCPSQMLAGTRSPARPCCCKDCRTSSHHHTEAGRDALGYPQGSSTSPTHFPSEGQAGTVTAALVSGLRDIFPCRFWACLTLSLSPLPWGPCPELTYFERTCCSFCHLVLSPTLRGSCMLLVTTCKSPTPVPQVVLKSYLTSPKHLHSWECDTAWREDSGRGQERRQMKHQALVSSKTLPSWYLPRRGEFLPLQWAAGKVGGLFPDRLGVYEMRSSCPPLSLP